MENLHHFLVSLLFRVPLPIQKVMFKTHTLLPWFLHCTKILLNYSTVRLTLQEKTLEKKVRRLILQIYVDYL